jgi:pimeloyl-ACP methyl ester carboxylesterase
MFAKFEFKVKACVGFDDGSPHDFLPIEFDSPLAFFLVFLKRTRSQMSLPAAARFSLENGLKLAAAALLLSGVLALIVTACFVESPGPVVVQEQSTNVWLSAILTWLAVASLMILLLRDSSCWTPSRLTTVFFALMTFTSSLMFVAFCVAVYSETAFLAALIVAASVAGLASDHLRRRRGAFEKVESGEAREPRLVCCLIGWNKFLNGFCVLLFTCLLCAGAISAAINASFYPAGGVTVAFQMTNDAREMRMVFKCAGPVSEKATLMFLPDGSHGLADGYPLQAAAVAAGRRMCIFDRPGLGHSAYIYSGQNLSAIEWLGPFLSATKERPPFALVGWGGGGADAMHFARVAEKGLLSSLVLLATTSEGTEFREKMAVDNWTEAQAIAYRNADLPARGNLFALIRGLGVPWALMSLFLGGPEGYADPAHFYAEYRAQYLLAKSWCTQFVFYKQIRDTALAEPTLDNRGVSTWSCANACGLPLLAVFSDRNESAIECQPDQCARALAREKYYADDAKEVANFTQNALLAKCTDKDCGLGMPLNKPTFVIAQIVNAGL